jgi:hypothetical protein
MPKHQRVRNAAAAPDDCAGSVSVHSPLAAASAVEAPSHPQPMLSAAPAAQHPCLPPPQSHYMDHVTRRRHGWPSAADASPLSCVQLARNVMALRLHIAPARAFCLRRLLHLHAATPPPLPLYLTRALDATSAPAVGACERARVRSSDIARLACSLATGVAHSLQRCRCAEVIAERVYGGYCQRVEVRCSPRCLLLLTPVRRLRRRR